ncbi:pyridoxal-dependent decarboxylase domain-containing protein 1-like isoform X1 [Acipenser ruthenus]|uniref:pyridoxal-dependent decarboxylase domain-containing protein 1-like isoform X1 n=1 Tax=Acipenser ruthenus TaxID=7906 RepID=UPI00145B4619|nr:pyridoxal-dependent decarboxylase domain-containing protein 1-like isoform X1 [Acipenser ruthenus]
MDTSFQQIMVDPTLAEMGKNLNEAMRILEDGHREREEDKEKRRHSRKDIPGPLQGSGQDVAHILQLVQNLMHGNEDEDLQSHRRMQNVGEQGHMALLGHSLAAYISVLDKERLRKLTTRILSDTTLWLCRLFRYENGSAYYHEDDREGLLKVCRLVIHSRFDDYSTEGFNMLYNKQPVIYQSAACRSGLGQHLCNQLGLPLSSLCTVPCNTMFGSQHQMDVALLDRLIKDDMDSGKLPLLLIANAGTPAAGHTDKLGRLKELCAQYSMWLHVEGVNLATLALAYVKSSVMAATKCDSMTLTLGPWLGLPAVPAVTLYRHEDPSLSLAAGLNSSQPVEKLRALPLWLSLQYLGHDGIVERIRHASQLSQRLLDHLTKQTSITTAGLVARSGVPPVTTGSLGDILGTLILSIVEDDLNSPVVVFRFAQTDANSAQSGGPLETFHSSDREILDALNRWLGEQLALLVPASGVDIVDLEDEGSCVRFSPLMTAAVLGTKDEDVDMLAERLQEKIPVLISTLRLREEFREEVHRTAALTYIEDLSWPGLGTVRYEMSREEPDESKRQVELEKINSVLLKKLKELDSDLTFSTGPEFGPEKNCVYIGMATEDLDVAEVVEMIATIGREIEENSRLLENMTEVVCKGILEAELQLQKATEEKLMEEGVLRQLPVVGSVLNWFSPVQSSVKGRTFNLAAGSVDSTEPTYSMKAQSTGETPPPTPTSARTKHRLPGQKLFRRSLASSDCVSETSSVGQVEELEKEELREPAPEGREADVQKEPEPEPEQRGETPGEGEGGEQEGKREPEVEGRETEHPDSLR